MSELPPAGWYPDPDNQSIQRYWDGSGWTYDTAPIEAEMPGAPGPQPIVAQEEAPADDPPEREQGPAPEDEPLEQQASPAEAPGLKPFAPAESEEQPVSDAAAPEGEAQSAADRIADLSVPAFASAGSSDDPQLAPIGESQTEQAESAEYIPPPTVEDAPEAVASVPASAGVEVPPVGAAVELPPPVEAPVDIAPPPVAPVAQSAPVAAPEPQHSHAAQHIEQASDFAEVESGEAFTVQNSELLKVELSQTAVMARAGAMVAYQGDVQFERQGGGVKKMFKKTATGEGITLMSCSGSGEIFLAHQAEKVHVLRLNGEMMTVNGANLLAFEQGIQWDITKIKGGAVGALAGGLFNVALSGTGLVALISDGRPVQLDVAEAPTFVDPQAAVAWSGGVTTSLNTDVSAKSLIGMGSGEGIQMAMTGQGWVLVQPSEGRPVVTQ